MSADQHAACEEYILGVAPEIRRLGHFQITVASGKLEAPGSASLEQAYARAHAGTISPLLAVSSECRISAPKGLDAAAPLCPPPSAHVERWRLDFLRRERSRWSIAMVPEVRWDAQFWWWLACNNTRPIIVLRSAQLTVLADVFSHSFDPVVVGNMHRTTARSAIAFAQKQTGRSGATALLLTRTVHSVNLTIVARSDTLGKLFELAIERAQLTAGFRALHCTDWVRPTEIAGPGLWTKVNSSRDDLSILVDALRRARDAHDYAERVTLNGLAAAELVAAIFGRPPTVFYGKDQKIDDAIGQWAKRIGDRTRLAPEAVDLARSVVQKIAAESPLPEHLWRSQRRRAAWRVALADLERRLA